jgi:hypothetical protein
VSAPTASERSETSGERIAKGADSGRLCRFRVKGGVPAKARATPGKDDEQDRRSRLLLFELTGTLRGRLLEMRRVRIDKQSVHAHRR